MDIQKEREAFEQLPEINQWIDSLRYGEKTGVYIAIDNNKHEGIANWVNGAWFMWQAKAQAVPDGYVLVPKEPTQGMIEVGMGSFDFPLDNGRFSNHDLIFAYRAMLEVQEQKFNLDEFLAIEEKLKHKGGVITADLDRFTAYAEMVLEKAKALKEPK